MQYCIEHTKGFKLVDVSCIWPVLRYVDFQQSMPSSCVVCGSSVNFHTELQGKTRDIYANIFLQFWFVLLAVQEARAACTPIYMLFDDKVGRQLCGFALQILCLVILAKLMKAQLPFVCSSLSIHTPRRSLGFMV